jgi:hypothetical protein
MEEFAALAEAKDAMVIRQDAVHPIYDNVRLLLESGFVRCVGRSKEPFFVKRSDMRELRYPLHIIIPRIHAESERSCWQIQLDRHAYDLQRVNELARQSHIRSHALLSTERTCRDIWWISSFPLVVHEAMALYDILNESRYSQ